MPNKKHDYARRDARIVEMRRAGKSYSEISAIFPISADRVKKICQKATGEDVPLVEIKQKKCLRCWKPFDAELQIFVCVSFKRSDDWRGNSLA